MIKGVLEFSEMNIETRDSFESLISQWGPQDTNSYLGWMISDLVFKEEGPTMDDLDKMIVDDWIVEQGVPDDSSSCVLIKYNK